MENEKALKFNPEEMMKAADERFLELMKNGKYAELLATMPTLGRYSLRNQLLILMQNPNATNVNQMRAWNYQKWHIVKGEKAMKIITPKFGKQVVTDENGNAVEKTLDKITGYETTASSTIRFCRSAIRYKREYSTQSFSTCRRTALRF